MFKDENHSLTISEFVKDILNGQVYFKKSSHARKFYLKLKKVCLLKFKNRIKMPTKIHVVFMCHGLSQKTIDSFWKDITIKLKNEEFL